LEQKEKQSKHLYNIIYSNLNLPFESLRFFSKLEISPIQTFYMLRQRCVDEK